MHRGIACLIGLGLAAGCAANGGDESILVLRNIVAAANGGSCVFTGSTSETGLASGALDVTLLQGYQIAPQIKSRITAVTGQEDLRTILIRGANVDIAFPNSTVFSAAELADFKSRALTHFMAPFSGFLPPNGGMADIPFEVIPAELALAAAAKTTFTTALAVASFQIVGDLGGGEVTSQTFQYPVTMVNGGFTVDNGPCLLLASSFVPRIGNPCFSGQDGPTDCCSQSGRPLVCPAVGMGQ
jgi:hypothetical protein